MSWFLDQLGVSFVDSFLLLPRPLSLALRPPLPPFLGPRGPPFCFCFAGGRQALSACWLKVVFSLLYFSIWARDRHFFAPLQHLADLWNHFRFANGGSFGDSRPVPGARSIIIPGAQRWVSSSTAEWRRFLILARQECTS